VADRSDSAAATISVMAAARSTRRLFQFSITSLLLLTALVAVWLAWELAFIRERQAWLRENPGLRMRFDGPGSAVARVPWWRSLLGDAPTQWLVDDDEWTDNDRAYVVRLFPEAELIKVGITTVTWTPNMPPTPNESPKADLVPLPPPPIHEPATTQPP
jgi:hypothetical protein